MGTSNFEYPVCANFLQRMLWFCLQSAGFPWVRDLGGLETFGFAWLRLDVFGLETTRPDIAAKGLARRCDFAETPDFTEIKPVYWFAWGSIAKPAGNCFFELEISSARKVVMA